MGNILSQSQIDELLNSVKDGGAGEKQLENDINAKKIKKYDFNTPKKYTKDRLKFIFSIYENYARVISSYLTSILRLGFTVELVDIEEQKYHEFNNALSEHDLIALVGTKMENGDDDDTIMIQISNQIMYAMMDRMLGGNGDCTDVVANIGFTDIELSIYEVILNHMLPIMKDAWQNYLEVDFTLTKIESNPRLVQTISSDEVVLIVILSIELKGTTGQINICLPGRILDTVFKTFGKTKELGVKRKDLQDEKSPEEIFTSIRDSSLEILAKLGEAEVLMGDVYQMQVGDVINLRKPQNSDVLLYIENRPWFRGKMGVQNGNMAVKINGTITNK